MPLPAGHPPFSSFSSFHGFRAPKPLFYLLECRFVIFAIFVKTPFFCRDKSTVYQKHRFRDAEKPKTRKSKKTRRRTSGFKQITMRLVIRQQSHSSGASTTEQKSERKNRNGVGSDMYQEPNPHIQSRNMNKNLTKHGPSLLKNQGNRQVSSLVWFIFLPCISGLGF